MKLTVAEQIWKVTEKAAKTVASLTRIILIIGSLRASKR